MANTFTGIADLLFVCGDDLEDVQGEQYTCRCGGWFQIDYSARRIKGELPPNKGIPG
ncbi:hypothetical protein [Stutzerimonas nitrititolerans]|uniref:hypothetical protein n=1 Tax=Stutzerimonas nitrititolerans TaxID=2482751 RepID=UPI00289C759E|nr:hypothetical protein [Stutzerimonas nitrititolerans]